MNKIRQEHEAEQREARIAFADRVYLATMAGIEKEYYESRARMQRQQTLFLRLLTLFALSAFAAPFVANLLNP